MLTQPHLVAPIQTSLARFKLTQIQTRINFLSSKLPPITLLQRMRYHATGGLYSIRSSTDGSHTKTNRFSYDDKDRLITGIEERDIQTGRKRRFQLMYNQSNQLIQAREINGLPLTPFSSADTSNANQRVEYQYENNKLHRVIHHWSPFDDDAHLYYNSSDKLTHFKLQHGAFNVQWSGPAITRITAADPNWGSDFRFEYSHGRVQRIHAPGITYSIYYNKNDLIKRVVLLDELYDRHYVTLYSYTPGNAIAFQPTPAFEHGAHFDFFGKPTTYFPLVTQKSIFGI